VTKPSSAWKEIGIWTGAPILISSGLVAFLAQWRTIARAIGGLIPARSKVTAGPGAPPGTVDPSDVEVPFTWFVGGMLLAPVGSLSGIGFGTSVDG